MSKLLMAARSAILGARHEKKMDIKKILGMMSFYIGVPLDR